MQQKLLKYSLLSYLTYKTYHLPTPKCCGIIGYIGQKPIADQILKEGINLLQNRGYDSTGIATIQNQNLKISKFATKNSQKKDCIQEIIKIASKIHKNTKIGIGHTRWATCGTITDSNAHPHTDSKNRIALCHNGTIFNFLKLKENLIKKGYIFKSQTDSEVIAMQIGYYLDQEMDFMQSVRETCQMLDGTWGLVIIHKNYEDKLICGRSGSPLLIGFGEDAMYVSSEPIAFSKYTNKYIRLREREIIKLSLDEDLKVEERMITFDKVEIKEKPSEGFRCFYEEEIFEQPESIKRALGYYHRLILNQGTSKLGGFDQNKEKAMEIKNMVLIGCGSSYNACLYGRNLFRQFELFNTVTCIEASDFHVKDLPREGPGILFLSQSGETADVLNVLRKLVDWDLPKIGISNVVGNMMTTFCDFGVYQNSGREVAVAASKTFSSQIIILHLIALWYSHAQEQKKYKKQRFNQTQVLTSLPFLIKNSLDKNKQKIKELAKLIYKLNNLFIISKGKSFPFAREMALKIKEICYIHAEAFPAGEMKHGPLALINSDFKNNKEEQTVMVVIVLDDDHLDHMKMTIQEIKSREGFVVAISDCEEKLDGVDFVVGIPNCQDFGGLLSLFPVQELSLEVALLKGINPDKPRNLAKTVTVV